MPFLEGKIISGIYIVLCECLSNLNNMLNTLVKRFFSKEIKSKINIYSFQIIPLRLLLLRENWSDNAKHCAFYLLIAEPPIRGSLLRISYYS